MLDQFFGENGVAAVYMYATPIHIALILFEMFYSYKHREHRYSTSDTATNLYMAILNFGLDIILKAIGIGVMFFFYQYRIFDLNTAVWWYWVGVFLLQDFAYYLHHLIDHKSRLFWAVHVTHHNSEYFNITTGFRSPVFQPFYRFVFFSPIALLGFNPWHIMSAYAIFQIWGTWVHTQSIKSMGILEHILVTPSHHRVHHASNIRYLDKNMGMGLIIWDKIFGTFEKEDHNYEPIKYGLTKPLENKGPINIVFHEWKAIWKDATQKGIGWKDRWNYIFQPPGWSHTGEVQTSRVLQQKEKNLQV
jgi:sterol desaturase/sphingolipid hydroxylase (fatty acid hydroxylase superfamily)